MTAGDSVIGKDRQIAEANLISERLSRYGTITRGTVPHTLATVIAVGLTGSDVSFDAGLHWHTFDTGQFDTVSCAPDGSCWASGDLGRVAILRR